MIELKNVSKYYTSNGVTNKGLIDVNLKLNKGEIVAITGESGSGKSTLLNVITKIDSFDEGEIYYKGNETSYFSIDDMDQFRKNKIGFIFQNYNIIDSYTVLENVMLPLIINGASKLDAKKEALEIIKKTGLSHRTRSRGSKLSGGEKQRCVIARALASKSEILACDEPTGNLDSKTSEDIINLIKEVAKDKLVLIVTHNYEQVKDIATRKIKIEDGRVVEDLKFKEVEDNEIDETIDLDYKPIASKINTRIACNNLTSTPKTSFLIGLVLLFTCIICLFLYQMIYTSNQELKSSDTFSYGTSDKLVVNDIDHKILTKDNLEKISDNYYINEFYLLDTKECFIDKTFEYDEKYVDFFYEPYIKDFKMVSGTKDTKDTSEIVLALSSKYYTKKDAKKYLGRKVIIDEYKMSFNVVGVGLSDNIKTKDFAMTNNKLIHTIFKVEAMMNVSTKTSNTDSISFEYDLNSKTTLYVNSETQTFDGFKYFNQTMLDLSSKRVVDKYIDKDVILNVGGDIFDSEVCFEASCYGKNSKMEKAASKLDYYTINTNSFTTLSKYTKILKNFQTYASLVGGTLVMVIVYFITYAILTVIFKSKQESYNIFRTLGVTKKDMSHIVRKETMVSFTFVSVFSILLMLILGNALKEVSFFSTFQSFNIVVIILYFAVMLVMGLLVSRRFNKKLFNFTVREKLKVAK